MKPFWGVARVKGHGSLFRRANPPGLSRNLYFSPSTRPGNEKFPDPRTAQGAHGVPTPSQPLKSPTALTRRPLVSQTRKCTPAAPSLVKRWAPLFPTLRWLPSLKRWSRRRPGTGKRIRVRVHMLLPRKSRSGVQAKHFWRRNRVQITRAEVRLLGHRGHHGECGPTVTRRRVATKGRGTATSFFRRGVISGEPASQTDPADSLPRCVSRDSAQVMLIDDGERTGIHTSTCEEATRPPVTPKHGPPYSVHRVVCALHVSEAQKPA